MIHFYRKNHRIGLDIDEVLADFLGGFSDHYDIDYRSVKHFAFSYDTLRKLNELPADFWSKLKPKIDGTTLPFLPTCYISTRNFDVGITEEWLERLGFPCQPVIHVGGDMTKVEACKKLNLDIFVDDHIKNFQELHQNGINALLMDCVHNQQYQVNPYRIHSLYELPAKITELNW